MYIAFTEYIFIAKGKGTTYFRSSKNNIYVLFSFLEEVA